MKKLNKLQQLSFIIRREYLAISTSYAVFTGIDGWNLRVRIAL